MAKGSIWIPRFYAMYFKINLLQHLAKILSQKLQAFAIQIFFAAARCLGFIQKRR